MTTVYDLVSSLDGKGNYLYKYGFGAKNMAEYFLFMYDLSELNKDDVNWSNAPLKWIGSLISETESGESVKWKDENMKEAPLTIDVVNSATSFDFSTVPSVWQELYNKNTLKTYVVTAVSGSSATISGAGDAAAAVGDVIVLGRYGKKYGADDGLSLTRNDTTDYENFIHFGEYQHDFLAKDLNKTYTFLRDPKAFVKARVGDMARKAIWTKCASVFVGQKLKVTSPDTRYFSGGLDEFIPSAYKVNIFGSTDARTKELIQEQITIAYSSGVNTSNMMLAMNSKMKNLFNRLWYEPHLTLNDKINSINLDIRTYDVGGYNLQTFHSNVLESLNNSTPLAYLIPMDHLFLFNLPTLTVDGNANTEKNYDMMLYKKPQTTKEKATLALMTSHSAIFAAVTSGAFQRWTYIKS